MNVQRHARIEQIKKLSEYMRRTLTLIGYFLWLGWPIILVLTIFSDKLDTLPANILIEGDKVTLLQRIAVTLVWGMMLLLTQKTVQYSRDLMERFSEGDIFNTRTTTIARKALTYGLIGLVVEIGFEVLAVFVPTHAVQVDHFGNALGAVLNGFLFFGLMYVMLWTLEIGRDLHEESELTI